MAAHEARVAVLAPWMAVLRAAGWDRAQARLLLTTLLRECIFAAHRHEVADVEAYVAAYMRTLGYARGGQGQAPRPAVPAQNRRDDGDG